MKTISLRNAFAALCIAWFAITAASAQIAIDTVPIGNPGNPNDTNDGDIDKAGVQSFGSVGYAYQIGKHEVSLDQYTTFLNAVAATDTYGLYNTGMGTDLNIKGIVRSGSPGSYTYAVSGYGNFPVTYVSWLDAARFANWIHNGQPAGAQNATTTEDGAYTLNGVITFVGAIGITRNGNARYWIPSVNEWYKAAYYDPTIAGANKYWMYATRTNATPNSRVQNSTDSNSANWWRNDGNSNNGVNDGYAVTNYEYYISTQNYLTAVGAYTLASNYYGTFDQNGNVMELTDTEEQSSWRVVRGGSWRYTSSTDFLTSGRLFELNPADDSRNDAGFRLATVPEPTVTVSLIFAGGLLLVRRRRTPVISFAFAPTQIL